VPSVYTIRRLAFEAVFYIGLLSLLAAVVFPFYWMIQTSLSTGAALFSYPPSFVPDSLAMQSYRAVLRDTQLGLWLLNSLIVSAGSTVLALAAGVSGAYALSRFRYRGKQTYAVVILTTQMMPPLVLVIPIYGIFIWLDLVDTLLGLVLANFAFSLPVVVWMMKSIFDSIPLEIEESARIDGASWPRILWSITLPLSLPGLVATGIFSFLNGWDEFMMARIVVTATDRWVGSVGLASFIGVYVTPWDQILAAAVMFTLPPIVLFLMVQRYFVAGLGAGAVKG
jgi:multiple sugar transport system permease protein